MAERSRLSLALIVGILVVVAGVVWRADPSGSGTSPMESDREAGEPTAGQPAASAEATLAEIAEITDDFSRNAAVYRLARGATPITASASTPADPGWLYSPVMANRLRALSNRAHKATR